MLERLQEIGIINLENGKLSQEDAKILLHIYKLKLDNQKIDISDVEAKVLNDKNLDLAVAIDEIEKLHKSFAIKNAENWNIEGRGGSLGFEELSDKVEQCSRVVKLKRENFEVLNDCLSSEEKFNSFCANLKIQEDGKDRVKVALQAKKADICDEYLRAKIGALNFAVDYAAISDIREGKIELASVVMR